MATTAEHCGQVATQATAAAAAFDTAHAMTVPPPLVAANRARLMALIATNIFGQNTPAIMSTESEYSEMWAQGAAAMYSYAANSASASALSPLPSPPQLTNPDAGHVGAVTPGRSRSLRRQHNNRTVCLLSAPSLLNTQLVL